jgi:integrase
LAGYRSNLQAHVIPAFAGYQLRHVDRMAVEEWVADLQASGLGPSGIRQARQVLNSMLTLAVDAGYLPSNPVEGVRTPRQPEPSMRFLDTDQVEQLATSIREPYGTLVYLLAYGGLRWGEAAALRRRRCDLLDEHLARHVPSNRDALVFTSPLGAPLRNSNFRRQVWYPAVEQAGLPNGLRIHDLRHTCASLLIAAGANPKAVQLHLGHSSITVTMDRYTHLFPSDVDDLVRRLTDIRARSLAAQPRPNDRTRGIELGGR